ncbi:MAG: amylo-alpha-1,6-glucosidase, partial [Planctomycetota bacterium]|nr:amylo-alpha-1,6-glucosidase [Planctomycetota bacterium]
MDAKVATDPSPRIRLTRESGLQPEHALAMEWLETNGRGGYASSTPLLCPTRRYHGLLVTPIPGTAKRHMFLSRFDETARVGSHRVRISMAQYPGAFSPAGHEAADAFELAPYPRTWYRVGNGHVLREIVMVHGEPAVLCRYTWLAGPSLVEGESNRIELRLRPQMPVREADALTFENMDLNPRSERTASGFWCRPYEGLPRIDVCISNPLAHYEPDPVWHRQVEYGADLLRGYDGHEDHFSPGWLHVPLEPGQSVVVATSIAGPLSHLDDLFEREASRRRAAMHDAGSDLGGALRLASEAYLYRTIDGQPGVVAGWPWFLEWGRDTAISIPGLTLAHGQVEACGEVLERLAGTIHDGLIPNIFGVDRESSHYGSVDASLWFARAVRLYDQAGGDRQRLQDVLRPALAQIADAYSAGGPLGIQIDASGLLLAGDAMHNATWMDARVDGVPVTPRDGAAVELNALWYQLLAYLEELAKDAGDTAEARQRQQAKRKAGRAFLDAFWIEGAGYLADVVTDGAQDDAVRPNMVIAAALDLSPLTRAQRASVVDCA